MDTKSYDPRNLFQVAPANIEGNRLLREPQEGAYHAVKQHFHATAEPAIVQLPVGCGKTGLMAVLPFGISHRRVLLVAPNVTIRDGLFRAMQMSSPDCFWWKAGILRRYEQAPFCAVLDGPDANLHDCQASHIVVANIQRLVANSGRWLQRFDRRFFDMVLIDEGHHNAAPSWQRVLAHFSEAKVVSLTATPFRSDEKSLTGKLVYRYSFTRAMARGYIKYLKAVSACPSDIYFTLRGDERHYSLAEVRKLSEEQWFRRGVALAEECNRNIVEASITCWRKLRAAQGTGHQIIAAACSVDHAQQVRRLYEEQGIQARELHSLQRRKEQEATLKALRSGELDCVVQVQILGEGFDHPPLSVAAIFRPFGNLAPYVQFVGRIMRVMREGCPGDVDNQGIVVSHCGLNNEKYWYDFRALDESDRELFQGLVQSEEVLPTTRKSSGAPREATTTFEPDMLVAKEIIGEIIHEDFQRENAEQAVQQLEMPLPAGKPRETPPETTVPVLDPQGRRRESNKSLQQATRDAVGKLLGSLDVSNGGREVSKVFPGLGWQNNWLSLTKMVNRRLNESLGIAAGQRRKLSLEQTERAHELLPKVCNGLYREIAVGMGKPTGTAKPWQVMRGVTVITAARQQTCAGNPDHAITKGESCLAIRSAATPGNHLYCAQCAGKILERIARDTSDLTSMLQAVAPSAAPDERTTKTARGKVRSTKPKTKKTSAGPKRAQRGTSKPARMKTKASKS